MCFGHTCSEIVFLVDEVVSDHRRINPAPALSGLAKLVTPELSELSSVCFVGDVVVGVAAAAVVGGGVGVFAVVGSILKKAPSSPRSSLFVRGLRV